MISVRRFLSRFALSFNRIIFLLYCIHSNCLQLLRARVIKKKQFQLPFFVAGFDENSPYLGLSSEIGFNDRDLMGISNPERTNSEKLFHLCQAVRTRIIKLHGFSQKIIIKIKAFFGESSKWAHRSDVQFYYSFVLPRHPAVSGFLNFENQMYIWLKS